MAVDIPRLESERLIFREFRDNDIDALARIYTDADVARYITFDGKAQNREFAWRVMTNLMGHWALRGFGMWALEEKSTGALVGYSGPYYPETWPAPEIGWTLGKSSWGKGYAIEAARVGLAFARDALKWRRVIHVIHPDNTRSIAVAERLGSKRDGEWQRGEMLLHIYAQMTRT